jgi:hypothetical protein
MWSSDILLSSSDDADGVGVVSVLMGVVFWSGKGEGGGVGWGVERGVTEGTSVSNEEDPYSSDISEDLNSSEGPLPCCEGFKWDNISSNNTSLTSLVVSSSFGGWGEMEEERDRDISLLSALVASNCTIDSWVSLDGWMDRWWMDWCSMMDGWIGGWYMGGYTDE